jgi:hypothetical protein
MLRKLLASVSFIALAIVAAAQPRIQTQTDPKNPIKPLHTYSSGKAVIVDTRKFSPQIGPSFAPVHEMPENPSTPPWYEINGEPNTLPLGGIIPAKRGNSGPMWPGINATGWFPPDPTIAVGPNHVVETVNATLAFYDKSGTLQFSQDAGTFFAPVKQTTFQFDPRVVYDRAAQRWVIIYDDQDSGAQLSNILVAVSDDSNPNGSWFMYRILAKATIGGNACWLDYPGFSYCNDGYVITGNMFSFSAGSFQAGEIISLPKAPMLTGAPVTASTFNDAGTFSAQMADAFDPTSTLNAYGVSRLNSTTLRVYAITNIATSPALNFTTVTVPSHVIPNRNGAPSSPGLLDNLDGRIFSASWRSGHVFCSHNVLVGSVNQVRWYDIALNAYPFGAPTLNQSGNLAPPTGQHFHMGAITSNGYNDVSATFTRSASSGVGKPCDSMAASRLSTDPLGTMGTPIQLATSTGTGYGSTGVNRWGDYFQCVVDPSDDATFWGVGMVANSSGTWQTVINSWTVTAPANLASNVPQATIQGGVNGTGTVNLDHAAPQYGYVVTLLSANPAVASVPASVTVPGGASSVNYTITTSTVTADTSVNITATLRGVNKVGSTTVLAPRLSGHVTLGDFTGTVAGQQVTILVRNPGTTTTLDSYTTSLDASGNFSVITSRIGTFDVAIKGAHWLRKVVANVTFNAQGAAGVSPTLTNGDINGDNVISLSDFTLLRTAFGSTPSDPNWNANADLNGDGAVSLSDFTILRAHFGAAGDN